MPSNFKDNHFYLGDFDEEMEREIILPLTLEVKRQARYKDGRIDLIINSYGGLADLAFHMVDLMDIAKRDGVVVRTYVPSAAYSAGSVVAVAGTVGERYIARDAQHLAHYGVIGDVASTPTQLHRSTSRAGKFFKKVVSHYQNYCDIPNLEEHILDDNWYISAQQAKSWKMADKYSDKMVL